jgi:outer membrane protein TolC
VLLAREMLTIAERDVAQKQKHFDEAQRKLDAGVATDYDVLAARVTLENARPRAIAAANGVRAAQLQLGFLLAEEGAVDASGRLDVAPEAPLSYDELLSSALEHRPEVILLNHQRLVYGELVKINGSTDRPRVDLRGAYGGRWLDNTFNTSSGRVWSAGLYLTFPFFDGLETRGRVVQARSDLRTSELQLAQVRQSVALQVRQALDSLLVATETMNALKGTVEQAERLVGMAEQGYELGVKTHLEVEDAQLNLLASRGNFAQAERDYHVARVYLEWVAGTLGEL